MPSPDDLVRDATEQALARHADTPGNLLPILHDIQHQLGCIPDAAVPLLASALQRSRAEIHGVITFYPHFRQTAPAGIVLEICRAESCQAMGGNALIDHVREKLGCDFHGKSTDGKVSLEPVYCLGVCAQSPAIMVNGRPYARINAARLDRLLADLGV